MKSSQVSDRRCQLPGRELALVGAISKLRGGRSHPRQEVGCGPCGPHGISQSAQFHQSRWLPIRHRSDQDIELGTMPLRSRRPQVMQRLDQRRPNPIWPPHLLMSDQVPLPPDPKSLEDLLRRSGQAGKPIVYVDLRRPSRMPVGLGVGCGEPLPEVNGRVDDLVMAPPPIIQEGPEALKGIRAHPQVGVDRATWSAQPKQIRDLSLDQQCPHPGPLCPSPHQGLYEWADFSSQPIGLGLGDHDTNLEGSPRRRDQLRMRVSKIHPHTESHGPTLKRRPPRDGRSARYKGWGR